MEPDLENMVVEGWVEFGSLPKTDAVRERDMTRHIVVVQYPIVPSF